MLIPLEIKEEDFKPIRHQKYNIAYCHLPLVYSIVIRLKIMRVRYIYLYLHHLAAMIPQHRNKL